MRKPKKTKPNDKEQATAFRKAARELGCDGKEERFQAALKTIAKRKPHPQQKKEAKA
jgi:hypothetical protein